MTKTQTNTFQVTEDQLDAVSGGVAPGGCIVMPDWMPDWLLPILRPTDVPAPVDFPDSDRQETRRR